MSDLQFTELVDLAGERLGGAAVACNDEFFAPMANLVKETVPVFLPDEYTDRGKWMDGWETRRRRVPGYDWCVVRLGLPGCIEGVVVETTHFKGNHPESCSLDACRLEGTGGCESARWIEVLPRSRLEGDSRNEFPLSGAGPFTHVRLNIFPDGGVARLRVHGRPVLDATALGDSLVDLAAAVSGGVCLAASDMFFGPRHNLIMPGPARNMGDGWETRRRRGPGNDWVLVGLAAEGIPHRIEVDTSFFKGNAPESCTIAGTRSPGASVAELMGAGTRWVEVLPRTLLEPNRRHFFAGRLRPTGPLTHLRLDVFPDGGVARLRVHGTVRCQQDLAPGLAELNALSAGEAESALSRCCGSSSWTARMVSARPFPDFEALRGAAEEIWWDLGREDWLEAFAAHPRIGERGSEGWSAAEQSAAQRAAAGTLEAIATGNREYEERFGHIYIVCAAGRDAEDLFAILRGRLRNSPAEELRAAAAEQCRIIHLRLEKLLLEARSR